MSIFLTATVVLLTLAAAAAVLVGLVFGAQAQWRRKETERLVRGSESLLRETEPEPEPAR